LTKPFKRFTLDAGGKMKRCIGWAVLAAALLGWAGTACSTSPLRNEIRFGIWASERGLWDEAIFRWKKAVAADPRSVAALNNLGVAYERKGLFDEAVKAYEAALAISPENSFVKSNYKSCKENLEAPKKPEAGAPNEKKK
jgi:tetratricopeptide (TPR) repeat protein